MDVILSEFDPQQDEDENAGLRGVALLYFTIYRTYGLLLFLLLLTPPDLRRFVPATKISDGIRVVLSRPDGLSVWPSSPPQTR